MNQVSEPKIRLSIYLSANWSITYEQYTLSKYMFIQTKYVELSNLHD